MARGGYRPGAGRPRKNLAETEAKAAAKPAKASAKNQKTEERIERIERTPLEYMVDVMNDPNADQARRDRMALAAAPFVHGKIAEVGAGKKEQQKQKAEELAKSGGKFAARSGPRVVVNNG